MSAPPQAVPPAAAYWAQLTPAALVARAVDFLHGSGNASAAQPSPAKPKAPKEAPPALTTNRDGFLARLVSFKTGEHAAAWAAQPAAIGAVAAARHGWHAAPKQRELAVTCRDCGASLTCRAKPMPWESRDEAAKTFAPQLKEAHHSSCPWRNHAFGVEEAGAANTASVEEERRQEVARRAAEAAAELHARPPPCFLMRATAPTTAACNATAAVASSQARGAELRCWPQPGVSPPHCVCCVQQGNKPLPHSSSSSASVLSPSSPRDASGAMPTGPFVLPPAADNGGGFSSPFRVTLISAVALVGAAVALLTFFYLLRAYQQASRLRELRLGALERRQRRRRRRRLPSSAVPSPGGGDDVLGAGNSVEDPSGLRPAKPVHVVEVHEPGGEVDLGLDLGVTTSAESDTEGGGGEERLARPTPATAPRAPDERIDAEQPDAPDAAAPPPRAAAPPPAALEMEPREAATQQQPDAEAVERPTANQSARALMLIVRVRRAFDGMGAAMRARRAARREREAAAEPSVDTSGAASPRLRASATVGEDGAVRIMIARAP